MSLDNRINPTILSEIWLKNCCLCIFWTSVHSRCCLARAFWNNSYFFVSRYNTM